MSWEVEQVERLSKENGNIETYLEGERIVHMTARIVYLVYV